MRIITVFVTVTEMFKCKVCAVQYVNRVVLNPSHMLERDEGLLFFIAPPLLLLLLFVIVVGFICVAVATCNVAPFWLRTTKREKVTVGPSVYLLESFPDSSYSL